MKNLKTLLIIIAVIGIAAYAGQDIIIETARLDGFIYGNKSGGIDSLIVPDADSLGQYKYQNAKDPTNPLDVVNLRTLLGSSSSGWDSIPFNPATGDQIAYLSGSQIYITNFDNRYIKLSDTTNLAITITQLEDSIDALNSKIETGLEPVIWTITLPNASTVQGRIDLAVEGTDYPTGWVLTADGLNILITHGLGRRASDATVWQATTGTQMQKRTGTNAYDGLYSEDVNTVRLNSLTTVPKDITIYLELAQ